ncbi:30S ribosome-binding factor RbfA [Clostridiaceae bacterium NSJ-31]|uniref:Ribosome-binding factor A n=2 Tax=Ligaoa zhengdingensis TaxID=2763658 RepID=A0A926I459_9FIRM|nr:30S ribosome-binding factor RbfA [Ligaoa zhengdingensis]MBC8545871.1 30S ribosome-binding factor RbfA [Ligaoa zhengdingensis]
MASYRADRTAEDVKRELTAIMGTLKDPRITGMLSIVKVDLARDLSACKVYISSLDGMEAAREAVKGLNNAAGFVRHELGGRLALRHTPSIKFIADNSIEQSAEILKIMEDIEHPKRG